MSQNQFAGFTKEAKEGKEYEFRFIDYLRTHE